VTVTATSVDESDHVQPQVAPASRAARLVRLVPALAAALFGVLLYVSFPPRTLWWLALPAFAGFAWVLRGRSWKASLGLGYLFGLGFLLPLLVWTGVEVGPVPWIALAAIEAMFVALVGVGVAAVSKLPAWPLWAAVWTVPCVRAERRPAFAAIGRRCSGAVADAARRSGTGRSRPRSGPQGSRAKFRYVGWGPRGCAYGGAPARGSGWGRRCAGVEGYRPSSTSNSPASRIALTPVR
jgi:hypothetical protein